MILRTVKFSIVLVNSLCFDLNFALRGFTNHAFVLSCRGTRNNREFKQITTASATTAAVTEKVWGEYVSVV